VQKKKKGGGDKRYHQNIVAWTVFETDERNKTRDSKCNKDEMALWVTSVLLLVSEDETSSIQRGAKEDHAG
jgi:hypothetical protein